MSTRYKMIDDIQDFDLGQSNTSTPNHPYLLFTNTLNCMPTSQVIDKRCNFRQINNGLQSK